MTAGDEGNAGDPGASAAREAPGIADALRELGAAGRSTWTAGRESFTALRILFSADVSLARSAFGRTLAFTGVAIAFGASAWLLFMAAAIAGLSIGLGWPWWLSLVLTATVSLVITLACGWAAMYYFEHTRLQATRRQLARLGIGELSGMMADAGSGKSAKESAEQVAAKTDEKVVKKGLGVDVTPP